MVLPGTELRRKAEALKIEFDPEPPYFVRSHFSMTPADVAFGLKFLEAVWRVGGRWTIRLLAREPGVEFTDVIDEWLDWIGGEPAGSEVHEVPPDHAKLNEKMRQFIRHFCALKRISPNFYEASSAIEFSARTKTVAGRV